MSEPRVTYTTPTVVESRPPYGLKYMAFSGDTSQDAAVRRFVARYGTQPAHVIKNRGNLYCGPVPEAGDEVGTYHCCAKCGSPLQLVRPGKWQCPECE